ncbi:MAG: hypothetical protein EXR72_12905 [Myxococcales bacterium]|nr:hypothetical protein [Myxococcales bacterium]
MAGEPDDDARALRPPSANVPAGGVTPAFDPFGPVPAGPQNQNLLLDRPALPPPPPTAPPEATPPPEEPVATGDGPTPRERIEQLRERFSELIGPPGMPLRQRRWLRIGLGVALGLGLGYLLATPHSRRADRAVAKMHADATALRTRQLPDLDARAATLDAEAQARSSGAGVGAFFIWILGGAAGTAAWLRFT